MKQPISTRSAAAGYRTKQALALLLLFLLLSLPGQVTLASTIQIYINEELLLTDIEPQLIDGRTFLPLRACSEALNATLDYNSATKEITIKHEGTKIQLTVGQTNATINGEAYTIDAAPFLYNDFTLVPLRFVSEALECMVDWDPLTTSVLIYTGSGSSLHAAQPSVDIDEKVPQVETIAVEALQQINNIRQQKNLETLITLPELSQMAEQHSRNMAENDYFSSQSPSYGSPAQRVQSYKLPTPDEIIAKVDFERNQVSAAVTAWMNTPETNALLLNPSASYIGIAAYRLPDSYDVYITAEVLPTRAYFTDMPQSSVVTSPELTLNGRSTARQETITIYKLAEGNSRMYTDKRSQTVTVNGTNFFSKTELWAKGSYAINIADCIIYVTYK